MNSSSPPRKRSQNEFVINMLSVVYAITKYLLGYQISGYGYQ